LVYRSIKDFILNQHPLIALLVPLLHQHVENNQRKVIITDEYIAKKTANQQGTASEKDLYKWHKAVLRNKPITTLKLSVLATDVAIKSVYGHIDKKDHPLLEKAILADNALSNAFGSFDVLATQLCELT
jgi:hypothetical protein